MFPNSTILNYLFWMLMGMLQIPVFMGMRQWALDKKKTVKWWQLVLMYGCFASLCLVLAGGMTLAGEYETRAGFYFIGFLGVAHVVAGTVMARLFVYTKPR
ncbi:MAG: hypothetical protein HUN05_05465 [Desulfobacter sp.]|nr:MAG: hypothetical protein HUN05_05465 [Desulfobacter sp.]